MNRTLRNFSIVVSAVLSTSCGHQDGAVTADAHGDSATAAASDTAAAPLANAAATILDACSLVSQADADAVLGTPGKLSEREKDDKHVSHCSYEAVDQSNGVNSFGVEIQTDENAADANEGQAMNKGMYSNIKLYDYHVLSGIGDDAFLAVSKPPSADFASGPAALIVTHQQVLMLVEGSKDIVIKVTYRGKERPTDALKALAKKLADKT